MEQFFAFLARSEGAFLLSFAFIILIGSAAIAAYAFVFARSRAEKNVATLIQERDRAVSFLTEAEEIGHVGSFIWNFEDESESHWSNEMFELFGLVARRKVPAIDSLLPYVHEGDRIRFTDMWKRATTQPGDFSFSFRTVSSRGQVRNLHIQGRTTIGADHAPKLIRGMLHDVTKEMEVDRAKSEFVSLASHQLKAPLTSVKWLSELLAEGKVGPLTEKQMEYAKTIRGSSQQMFDMVNELLNMSRIELGTLAMTLTDFEIETLMHSVLDEQQQAADKKSLTVKLVIEPKLPRMHADEKLTRMVLQNLLSNAIKYSRDGGVVEYELSLVSGTHKTIFVRVKDSGIGIPENEQSLVFEKLHRAVNAQKLVPDGTGLGLYVVKTVLARAGGGISFESKEGIGTTFFVSIPVAWSLGTDPA